MEIKKSFCCGFNLSNDSIISVFCCCVLRPPPGLKTGRDFRGQFPVVQTLGSAIHRINHYPADSVINFRNTYPLDSYLSGG